MEPTASPSEPVTTAAAAEDLTQHPGASANIPLYFRSGPLGSGSKVMFDVRGYVTVTRQ